MTGQCLRLTLRSTETLLRPNWTNNETPLRNICLIAGTPNFGNWWVSMLVLFMLKVLNRQSWNDMSLISTCCQAQHQFATNSLVCPQNNRKRKRTTFPRRRNMVTCGPPHKLRWVPGRPGPILCGKRMMKWAVGCVILDRSTNQPLSEPRLQAM